jgi:hypothetical protein
VCIAYRFKLNKTAPLPFSTLLRTYITELIKEDNKNELPKSQVKAFNGAEVFLK